MAKLIDIIKLHKTGKAVGVYSICSSNPQVLEAALIHAKLNQALCLLIEATCNQVNQFGGYTGLTPLDFKSFVFEIANKVGFPTDKIILGGDHLGPNPWQNEASEIAMQKAKFMVGQYIEAGFTKIHVDCSMACADDIVPLSNDIIANRAAILVEAAENALRKINNGELPYYVIGTEVPVPGGAHEEIDTLSVTLANDARDTINCHKDIFLERGLNDAWSRTIALVVQPGVEFDNHNVFDFNKDAATELSDFILNYPQFIYEAHSTDYQNTNALKSLVEGHFAILKVGPGLTFAFREAIWALDAIERECIDVDKRANAREFTIKFLKANPKYWDKYYFGNDEQKSFDINYSLSDRIRYYWHEPALVNKINELIANIDEAAPSFGLISQYFSSAQEKLRLFGLEINAKNLILGHIMLTLDKYFNACNLKEV